MERLNPSSSGFADEEQIRNGQNKSPAKSTQRNLDPNYMEVYKFLAGKLRRRDISTIEHEIKKRFPLSKERQVFKKRLRRRGCSRNPGLSNTKKRALGLYNINRKGLKFVDLLPLHHMWKKYMDNYLNIQHLKKIRWTGDVASNIHDEISQLLWKADYHGAYIIVSKSKCPSLVGIEGLLVFETKNTLKLLGKDDITRCVPKLSCEFKLKIDDYELKFLGQHFLVKSSERSVKKLRGSKFHSL